MRKPVIISFFIFAFYSCEAPYDTKLIFYNRSDKEIFVKLFTDKHSISDFLNNNKEAGWDFLGHYLMPDSSARFPAWYSWEKFIKKLDDKKVYFYVFDADSFRSYRLGLIGKNNLRYKQFDYNEEELIKADWIVNNGNISKGR